MEQSLRLAVQPKHKFPYSLCRDGSIGFTRKRLVNLVNTHLKAVKFLVYRYGFGTLDASHDGTFSVFVLRTSLEIEKQLEFFFFHCFLLAKLHFFEEL